MDGQILICCIKNEFSFEVSPDEFFDQSNIINTSTTIFSKKGIQKLIPIEDFLLDGEQITAYLNPDATDMDDTAGIGYKSG
ncbi:MAG: hypothetical protein Ta2F_17510 [Termitinemataceae bacterium]|nr:MAG: hypothetical protein Ta2F_17510 [Termitinemataceae bacterium]